MRDYLTKFDLIIQYFILFIMKQTKHTYRLLAIINKFVASHHLSTTSAVVITLVEKQWFRYIDKIDIFLEI